MRILMATLDEIPIKHVIQSRLVGLEYLVNSGALPEDISTEELNQLIGRIDELKYLLDLCTELVE